MVGKIYFLLVRIKIKHMEIAIIKKETSGTRECHAVVQVEGETVGRVGGREREARVGVNDLVKQLHFSILPLLSTSHPSLLLLFPLSPAPPFSSTAPNIYTENEQIAKYEIMDGAPVRGTLTYTYTLLETLIVHESFKHYCSSILFRNLDVTQLVCASLFAAG